jgi:hypothetical protein
LVCYILRLISAKNYVIVQNPLNLGHHLIFVDVFLIQQEVENLPLP